MDDIVSELFELLHFERKENIRLTNLILQHVGVSAIEGDTTVHIDAAASMDKIPLGRVASWPQRRAELERKYRAAAEAASEELIDLPKVE